MTILATHFSLVLGAWRLRVRIDIDEPRDDAARERHAQNASEGRETSRAVLAVPSSN